MPESAAKGIIDILKQTDELYHRLILLIGQTSTGKTRIQGIEAPPERVKQLVEQKNKPPESF